MCILITVGKCRTRSGNLTGESYKWYIFLLKKREHVRDDAKLAVHMKIIKIVSMMSEISNAVLSGGRMKGNLCTHINPQSPHLQPTNTYTFLRETLVPTCP